MNKELRKLSFSAADIGYCLVCGGVNGNCTCFRFDGSCSTDCEFDNQASYKFREFFDFRPEQAIGKDYKKRESVFFVCASCGCLSAFLRSSVFARCYCGVILKHDFIIQDVLEPDYSILEGLSELPSRASRKPKIVQPRKKS